jgi:hypothetical protein
LLKVWELPSQELCSIASIFLLPGGNVRDTYEEFCVPLQMPMRTRNIRSGWRKRVNPAYVRWWAAIKANRALITISDEKERTKELDRNFEEQCVASRLLNTERAKITNSEFVDLALSKPLDGEVWPWPINGEPGKGYITNPEACPFFRDLVFLRYGVTFRELVCEVDRNPKAYQQWMRVHAAYRRFKWGGSLDRSKMKFNVDHFQIIVQGLDFGFKQLNQEELAECLDEICPCGSQNHSSDYLKKLRARIIKCCRSLKARNARSTTVDP